MFNAEPPTHRWRSDAGDGYSQADLDANTKAAMAEAAAAEEARSCRGSGAPRGGRWCRVMRNTGIRCCDFDALGDVTRIFQHSVHR